MGGPGRPPPNPERAARLYQELEDVAWKQRLNCNDKAVEQPRRGHKNLVKENRNHVNHISGIMDWEAPAARSPKPKPAPSQPMWMQGGTGEVGPLG